MTDILTAPAASAPPKTVRKLYQSATRDETFLTCTQLYAAKYLLKIPDPSNDGAKRGDVVHQVLELLAKPRHRPRFVDLVQTQCCAEVPAIWRLLKRFAVRNGVADDENLAVIDAFIVVGIMCDFYGPPGTIEDKAEQEFTIEVNEPDGRRYNLRGFIDRTFVVKDEEGLAVVVTDYKSSKDKFRGEKVTWNTQAIIYQLVTRRLYPHIARRKLRFLFLKFKKDPVVETPPMSDDQLNGYEWILTDLQEAMEQFTVEQASMNLAAFDQDKQWLCGREGVKKDGTPCWICVARRPLDYWVIEDADGAIVKSAFTAEELQPEVDKADPVKGWRLAERSYKGCSAFYNPATGRPRNFK